ncbi:DNA repair protein XRCC1-like isoform X1 [Amphibalanus amphitrite]|uniref:DNA repair protein XRCC1-like isoform X1 n=1 Tax=Amphibalanus amphitrite TaxID=1232801 RepID=UPI001C9225A2|nr:DNA repair protein XRCC1-like isoform X1 [Amphibalanus amphitrite]
MPDIKISQVMAFSSEDPGFPANNLLCTESYKKWKSKSAGEKEVSVLLKFEKSSEIDAVHIGNEGSAFVEILVGKLGEDVRDFQVLLPTSSFMSPAESRGGTNPGRVRLFDRDKLSAAALGRPWDCARVVCTQPFCRTSPYGLAFVRFRSAEQPEKQPQQTEKQPAQQTVRLGAFTLKPESEDTIRTGGLFNRRAELGAAAGGGTLKRDDRSDRVVPPRRPPADAVASSSSEQAPEPTGHYQLKPETKQRARPENTPVRNGAKAGTSSPSVPAAAARPNAAQNKAEGIPKRPASTPKGPDTAPKKPDTTQKRDQKPAARGAGTGSSAPTSNGAAAGSGDASAAPRPPANAIYRPYKKLLSGVVFAMSGYQNPRRGDLREQGIKLGATYRPDWGPGCTHLICAFRNTPKFTAVRGKGKIVRGEWLTECAKQRRRLGWRKFATDPSDSRQPDSGDELWAEDLRPAPPPGAPQSSTTAPSAAGASQTSSAAADDDEYGGSTDDDIDTDDEIRMFHESKAKESSDGAAKPTPSTTSAPSRQASSPSVPRSTSPQSTATKRPPPSPEAPSKRAASGAYRAPVQVDSDDVYDADTDEDEPKMEEGNGRPDTSALEVPDLPDFLRGRTFLLYGDAMSTEERRQAARAITAFGGKLEQYFGDTVQYVITKDAWDENFDEAASDHPELMFVRPGWLEACARKGKFVPLQPYLVTAAV